MGAFNNSRRKFIKYGLATVAGTVALRLDGTPRGVKPTRIDAHGHTVPGLTADRVISLMDMAGISHMVLMARGRNDALTTQIYQQAPERILPFVRSQLIQ